MWFQGGVAEAITAARTSGKPLVVFLTNGESGGRPPARGGDGAQRAHRYSTQLRLRAGDAASIAVQDALAMEGHHLAHCVALQLTVRGGGGAGQARVGGRRLAGCQTIYCPPCPTS